MNTETISAYKRDLHPIQFIVIVFVGCVASALLSWLNVPGWVSLIVAGGIMVLLAAKRWQIAKENNRDYQSLEAFAEDIYLLGYLLTLSSLLGLAPRLMSDEKNLFHIAGLKLVTTVLGLAMMMVFRQTARRWAEEKEGEETQRFVEQQKLFSEAVGRLNYGADQLTSKLDEVVHWFDPKLLEPLSEWGNRAAGAFSTATTHLEAVPAAVLTSIKQLQALCDDLGSVRTAAGELSGILTAGTAQAANVLTAELGNAAQAAEGLGAAMAPITPASLAAKDAIEKLGQRAESGATEVGELGESMRRSALEMGKVERALKKVVEVDTKDVNAPMNRLAEALEAVGEKTVVSNERMELLNSELKGVSGASQELGTRLGAEIGRPLEAHQKALQGMQERLALAIERIASLAPLMEAVATNEQGRNGFGKDLLAQLSGLERAMGETNGQIKMLVDRIDGAAGTPGVEPKSGGFLGLFRGGR